jgi:hypothetical protein
MKDRDLLGMALIWSLLGPIDRKPVDPRPGIGCLIILAIVYLISLVGPWIWDHVWVILAIAIPLLFGRRLVRIVREGVREFKEGMSGSVEDYAHDRKHRG